MSRSRLVYGVLASFVLAACEQVPVTQNAPPSGTAESPAAPPLPQPSANSAPVMSGSPALTGQAGAQYSFTPVVTDSDGDTLAFSVYGKPSWASFDEKTGALTGMPEDADVGATDEIEIAVSDGHAQDSIGPFRILIAARAAAPAPNSAPTIGGVPPASVVAGEGYVFEPSATDADGDALTYAIANRPAWASFNTSNGRLDGTPGASHVGTTADIRISVTDGKATVALAPFSIRVTAAPNGAPTLSGSPATRVTAGVEYVFQPVATDTDDGTLVFMIENKPTWATFDSHTGRLSGTPRVANIGTTAGISIRVSDGTSQASLARFNITVVDVPNVPPTLSGSPPLSVAVGNAYTFTPVAADADHDSLTFTIRNRPVWATFSTSTGRLSGTPNAQQAGTYPGIVIGVGDGEATASLPEFAIQVSPAPNRAPTINGSPARSVVAGNLYSFTPTAADADGDSLSFTIQNKPVWADFNAGSGKLSGTPTEQQVREYRDIIIAVTDGKSTAALSTFTITVSAPAPTPPAPTPPAPTPPDPTPPAPTPPAPTPPAPTPPAPTPPAPTPPAPTPPAPTPPAPTPPAPTPNRAPVISGSPSTQVTAGSVYTFTPVASDPDGDTLTFSIDTKPTWATFNTGTGRLTGTPPSGTVGATPSIVISVSDGEASASLAAFSINVTAPVSRSATVSWTPPTTNTDGSTLTNLGGYNIYFGSAANALNRVQRVSNAGLTEYTIDGLSSGTWYFGVRAYNSSGVESSVSNVTSKTIP